MAKYLLILLFASLVFLPSSMKAQNQIQIPNIGDIDFNLTIPSPLTAITLEKGIGLFGLVLNTAYILFFIIAALMIVFTALDYLRSGGEDSKVRAAQSKLIYIGIAIAIALLSGVASSFVKNIIERGS